MVALNNVYQSAHNFETGNRVELALSNHNPRSLGGVIATAFCGIVELSGAVSTHQDKALAIRIAQNVAGVSTVVESIRIDQTQRALPVVARRASRKIDFFSAANHEQGGGRFTFPHGS